MHKRCLLPLSLLLTAVWLPPAALATGGEDLPVLTVSDAVATEGRGATAEFTVTLSEAPTQAVTFFFETADGTARGHRDYVPRTGSVRIGPGDRTTRNILVEILDDRDDEDDEAFRLRVSGIKNATLAGGGGLGTILDDEEPPKLSIDKVTVFESDGEAVFAISLFVSGRHHRNISVRAATEGSTARAGDDYLSRDSTVSFPATGKIGQRLEAKFRVPIVNDSSREAEERFFIKLVHPKNAEVAPGQGFGVGTITDDDALIPVLTIDDVEVVERDEGQVSIATFTARLDQPPVIGPVQVDFATFPRSAKAGEDYEAARGTLTFQPGQTERQVEVTVLGDLVEEADESFAVTLSNPAGLVIGRRTALAIIVNDEVPPDVTIDDLGFKEGNLGSFSAFFRVRLSEPSGEQVAVIFATKDDTALAGSDYERTFGRLVFKPGQDERSIQVVINSDTHFEGDETFFVVLSSVENAEIADGVAVGTIRNDDEKVIVAFCSGLRVTIVGEGVITGTSGNDVILGSDGHDVIDGRGGADTICGEDGDDTILGRSGGDTLVGGEGNDTINGGPDNDRLEGGPDNDRLFGGSQNDLLLGGDGTDLCDGGTEEDNFNKEDPAVNGCEELRNIP